MEDQAQTEKKGGFVSTTLGGAAGLAGAGAYANHELNRLVKGASLSNEKVNAGFVAKVTGSAEGKALKESLETVAGGKDLSKEALTAAKNTAKEALSAARKTFKLPELFKNTTGMQKTKIIGTALVGTAAGVMVFNALFGGKHSAPAVSNDNAPEPEVATATGKGR